MGAVTFDAGRNVAVVETGGYAVHGQVEPIASNCADPIPIASM
jgi:hypothetical protein